MLQATISYEQACFVRVGDFCGLKLLKRGELLLNCR